MNNIHGDANQELYAEAIKTIQALKNMNAKLEKENKELKKMNNNLISENNSLKSTVDLYAFESTAARQK